MSNIDNGAHSGAEFVVINDFLLLLFFLLSCWQYMVSA